MVANQERKAVKFHMDAESEHKITVLNTFLHVEEKTDRSPRRCKTAPECIVCAAAEAAVLQADESDDESDEEPVDHVKTYDRFENETIENKTVYMPAVSPTTLPMQMSTPIVFCTTPAPAQLPAARQEPAPRLLGRTQPKAAPKPLNVAPAVAPALKPEGSPLECDTVDGKEQLTWSVDGRTLDSLYKQKLSPEFNLYLPGLGQQPFRLMILAKETKGKGGRSFRKAAGHGRIFVKCETSLPPNTPRIAFRAAVSPGSSAESSKGPFWHQFFDQNCCGLQGKTEDWNLIAAVDETSKRFEILVEVIGYEVP